MGRHQTKIVGTTSPGHLHAPSPPGRKAKLLDQLRQACASVTCSKRLRAKKTAKKTGHHWAKKTGHHWAKKTGHQAKKTGHQAKKRGHH